MTFYLPLCVPRGGAALARSLPSLVRHLFLYPCVPRNGSKHTKTHIRHIPSYRVLPGSTLGFTYTIACITIKRACVMSDEKYLYLVCCSDTVDDIYNVRSSWSSESRRAHNLCASFFLIWTTSKQQLTTIIVFFLAFFVAFKFLFLCYFRANRLTKDERMVCFIYTSLSRPETTRSSILGIELITRHARVLRLSSLPPPVVCVTLLVSINFHSMLRPSWNITSVSRKHQNESE